MLIKHENKCRHINKIDSYVFKVPINTKCLTLSRSYYVYFNEVCALLAGLTFELTLLNKVYCSSIMF